MLKEIAFKIGGQEIEPPPGIPGGGAVGLATIVSTGIAVLLYIGIIMSLGYILWGAVDWVISKGDKAKLQQARGRIIYAIVGLVIALMAVFIIGAVGKIFGVSGFLIGTPHI